MPATFDAVVIGAGGFGSAVTYHLAKSGLRTLALDQFPIAHDHGSSHGETRAIRKAYFEHPDYVPALHRAYELWKDLEEISGEKLYEEVGILLSGLPDGHVIKGARLSARLHGIRIDEVTGDAANRFPGFRFPTGHEVLFEPEAGFLYVEYCIRAHARQALIAGAEIRTGESVVNWASNGTTVTVTTTAGVYQAASLVVTAGAWSSSLLNIPVPLQILRKPVSWFPVRNSAAYNKAQGSPVFLYELPEGIFYGFPCLDGHEVKVAEHSGGDAVGEPSELNRNWDVADAHSLVTFVGQVMPDLDPTPVRGSICMYTMTPDQHFVIDRHPLARNVVYAAGFSGHGFKFASSLGEALADMALDRQPRIPLEFLAAGKRFVPAS